MSGGRRQLPALFLPVTCRATLGNRPLTRALQSHCPLHPRREPLGPALERESATGDVLHTFHGSGMQFLSRKIGRDFVRLVYENDNSIHKLRSPFARTVWFAFRFTPDWLLWTFAQSA